MIRSTEACCKCPPTNVYECHNFPKPPFCPVGPTGPAGTNYLETLVSATIEDDDTYNSSNNFNVVNWEIRLDTGNNFKVNGEYKVPSKGIYQVEIVLNVNFIERPDPLLNEPPLFSVRNTTSNHNLIVGLLSANKRPLERSQVSLIQYLELEKHHIIRLVYISNSIGTQVPFELKHSTLSIKRIA